MQTGHCPLWVRRPAAARGAHRLVARALPALAALLLASPAPATVPATRLTELPSAWTDDRGQAFDLHSLQGHAVVLTMAYATCHRVCPFTIRRLQQLQRDYDLRGTPADFLVIGYDPENDDAAAWHQYRQSRHLTRDNWHFLVGTRDSVQQLARQLGFDFWKLDQHVIHDQRIVYFDATGVLVGSGDADAPQYIKR
jgi:cytochrome oxidase Cu insertion factor (SCO1/SenC/PrrC family)